MTPTDWICPRCNWLFPEDCTCRAYAEARRQRQSKPKIPRSGIARSHR